MGSAPEEQLEAEGQGISNDAAQHKQHEYRVCVEEMLVWKSHLDQRHGCGNDEAKNEMVDHIHRRAEGGQVGIGKMQSAEGAI
ncbi:hypothetical protein Pyn_39383 [Prunus yedoensis var. nudiflora]|uniref:Uncharacterized protein n=1 Tax=Prunus yedoensis var. nudiflora TaxID=2094558 RepID=A0A314ZA68_PRUYE|nr:hypothetical protein Pyn_39383 [Prunus yedoensis var. nudiflora]